MNILFSFAMLLLMSWSLVESKSLETLAEARSFAQQLPEYPDIENSDLLNPQYSRFYKSRVPSFISTIKTFLGLEQELWSSSDFFDLIENITQERENEGFWGRFFEKCVPQVGQHFYVITNVHGSYHSLIRILTELEHEGVLTNDYILADGMFH